MKQCFGYVRVSTVKQGEGVSLEAQREAIEAFARRENIEIIEWFEEKETAAKCGRPIFNAMVKKPSLPKSARWSITALTRWFFSIRLDGIYRRP
jgi:hypothetical protein